jgi:monoamine oxidase
MTIDNNSDFAATDKVVVQGINNECLMADMVICTVPPPLLPKLLPNLLTDAQFETLDLIGFETVLKVILKFNERPWPEYLQSVIWADGGPLPEIWFRNDFVVEGDSYHLMVGYLASDLADNFLNNIEQRANQECVAKETIVTEICLEQLSKIFSEEKLRQAHVDTLMHAWNATTEPYTPGGYMYPRVGLQTLEPLAQPCKGGRVVLAGEATNTNACCTLQSAMETGVRAANQVLGFMKTYHENPVT